jgi:hypothetical protein
MWKIDPNTNTNIISYMHISNIGTVRGDEGSRKRKE